MIYTIVDIETNSLSPYTCDILEMAYIRFDNKTLEILGSDCLYFYKPEFQVETKAQEVHGLTRDFLKQHEDKFDENLVKAYTALQRAVIVGKNSDRFDIPAITTWMSRHASCLEPLRFIGTLDLQEFIGPHFRQWVAQRTGVTPNRQRTGKLSEYMELFGYTSEEVYRMYVERFGNERARAHGAMYDVFMTYLATKGAVEKFNLRL